jgi:hypothetical protein
VEFGVEDEQAVDGAGHPVHRLGAGVLQAGIWLPLPEARTSEPVSVAAATLLTTNSGLATSFLISSAPVARSMVRMRGRMASYRPLALMSSSMPDSRSVSLAPVSTLAPSGIRSLMRPRAAAASSRISAAKPLARSADATRSSLSADAGWAKDAAGAKAAASSAGLLPEPCAVWGAVPASGEVSRYLTSYTRSANFQPSAVRR